MYVLKGTVFTCHAHQHTRTCPRILAFDWFELYLNTYVNFIMAATCVTNGICIIMCKNLFLILPVLFTRVAESGNVIYVKKVKVGA